MLSAYTEQIGKLASLQKTYDTLVLQNCTLAKEKRKFTKQLAKVKGNRAEVVEEVREKLINNKKDAFKPLLNKCDEYARDIKKLENREKSELENISLTPFYKTKEFDLEIVNTLSDTQKYIMEKLPELVSRYEYEYEVCKEELDRLADRCGKDGICKPCKVKVNRLTDFGQDEEKSKFEEILDYLSMKPQTIEVSTKYRAITYVAYLGVIAVVFLNLSFALIGAIGIGIKVIHDKKKVEENKKKCIEFLENFLSMYKILEESLDDGKDEFINKKSEEIKAKFADSIRELKNTLNELRNKYEESVSNVSISDDEINGEVDKEFANKIAEIEDNLKKIDEQIGVVQKQLGECETELDGIQMNIIKLKDEISRVYWELNEVGTSRVLTNEFFLGFKDYELVSVKHDGHALMIEYDGQSSERNSILISMFISQLFSNMLPNVLQISIVDMDYTCRDYSIYNGEYFDIIFNYITSSEEAKKCIDDLHVDLIKRQAQISPIADSIEEFNKMMVERQSFTKEYNFIIFQNADGNILKNQRLLQLCRTGCTFGIMPIMFVRSQEIAEIKNEPEKHKIEMELLESVEDYTWTFNHETLDLEKRRK